MSPAYGWCGTRATKNRIACPPKKIWAKPKQAGKKEGGLGEEIFARLLCAEGAVGWKATRPCVSKEAKPEKIDSLKEKIFCARPLKKKKKFLRTLPAPPLVERAAGAGFCPSGKKLSFKKGSHFV